MDGLLAVLHGAKESEGFCNTTVAVSLVNSVMGDARLLQVWSMVEIGVEHVPTAVGSTIQR